LFLSRSNSFPEVAVTLVDWLSRLFGCGSDSDPVLCCLLVSWFVLYPFFVLVVARQIGETLCRLVSWLRQAMFALFSYLFGHIFPSSCPPSEQVESRPRSDFDVRDLVLIRPTSEEQA